jgi:hypothetical protein
VAHPLLCACVVAGFRNDVATRRIRTTNVVWAAVVCGLAMVILLFPELTFGQGGPPLLTDDPDTPGPGFWEINLATVIERALSERRIEQPLADINYGVGERLQLKFEIPWLRVREGGKLVGTGPGNAQYGVKWRFLGEETKRVAWSIYPQLEVNSSKSMTEKELVTEGTQFFLPTEFTVRIRGVEINGEVGRNFVRHQADGWAYGASTEIETHLGLELLGELHGERSTNLPTEFIVNLGARQRIIRQIVLLVAVGTAVHGLPEERPRLRLYTGLQFNLPAQYSFGPFRNPQRPSSRGR